MYTMSGLGGGAGAGGLPLPQATSAGNSSISTSALLTNETDLSNVTPLRVGAAILFIIFPPFLVSDSSLVRRTTASFVLFRGGQPAIGRAFAPYALVSEQQEYAEMPTPLE